MSEGMNYGVQNLVSILDNATHGLQKRTMSAVFAKSYVLHSSDMDEICRIVAFERLSPRLERCASDGSSVNVFDVGRWAAMDMTSGYLFGGDGMTDYFSDTAGRDHFFNKAVGETELKQHKEEAVMAICSKVAKQIDARVVRHDPPAPVVFPKMYYGLQAKGNGGTSIFGSDLLTRCASEMLDHSEFFTIL
jgi:hypothetical protein